MTGNAASSEEIEKSGRNLFSLHGKTALVTGGGSGIGRMMATALASAGATVFIASRREALCRQAAADIATETGAKVLGFQGDVVSEEGVGALAAHVSSRCESLSILVNNAGKAWGAKLGEVPHHAWSDVLAVNLTGPFMLTQALLPWLEHGATSEDPARVINMGSLSGSATASGNAYSYAAAKAGVHHLTRVLARDLAPRGITVNALAPGIFPSPMTDFGIRDPGARSRVTKAIPLGRLGAADDLAAALLYLAGRGGSYVTGAVLPIDGGLGVLNGADIWNE